MGYKVGIHFGMAVDGQTAIYIVYSDMAWCVVNCDAMCCTNEKLYKTCLYWLS